MRKAKRLEHLSNFKNQLSKDLALALNMNEDKKQKPRINIVSISNARQKQSWLADIKAPLFYVNLARKCNSGVAEFVLKLY